MAKKAPTSTELAVAPTSTEIVSADLGGGVVVSAAAQAFLAGARGAKEAPPRLPIIGIDHDAGTFVMPSGEVVESFGGYLIYYFQTRKYYEKMYRAGQAGVPPDCWSADMVEPHPSAQNKQCDNCASCAHNVFGSARDNRGKACATATWLFVVNKRFGAPPIGCMIAPPSSIRPIFGTRFAPGYIAKAQAAHGAYQIVHTTFSLKRDDGAKHCVLEMVMGSALREEQHIQRLLEIHNAFRDAMEQMRSEEAVDKEEREEQEDAPAA